MIVTCIAGGLLAACASGNVIATRETPDGSALILSGDNRAILFSEQRTSAEGRISLRCAEPQPDAIRAIAQEFAAAIKGSVPLGGTAPEGTASLASATREAVAELGKRTPTIQLMRDFLYRACEARMNQVIQPGRPFQMPQIVWDGTRDNLVYANYGFDQLTVDIIKQIDNMTIALHAVDGLTGMGNVGRVTISAESSGVTKVSAADGTAEIPVTKLKAEVTPESGSPLDKESVEAITVALIKIVAIALDDRNGVFAFPDQSR
ncbi:MAG: hypothetical protein Kilf2KO_26270 [Rhodospirillales bacterium]